MNYKAAGVNIDLADSLIDKISTKSDQIGKFAANFTLDKKLNRELVASCDGVGTKILLALEAKSAIAITAYLPLLVSFINYRCNIIISDEFLLI